MLRPHGIRLGVVSGLLAALALLPGAALANGPVIFRDSWENNPEFWIDCRSLGYGDFFITSESDGRIEVKEWYDADGNIQRAHVFLWINNVVTTTWGNGSTQTWEDPGRHTDFYDFENGEPVTHKRAGLSYNVHGPDGGVILHDTGSFVFNFETGQLEHTGGPKDYWSIADNLDLVFERFCTTFS
jgi:hypothetical protein